MKIKKLLFDSFLSMVFIFLFFVQNNLERSDFESKTRMTNQLEGMERELSLVRRRLDGETDQHQTALKSWMVSEMLSVILSD